MKKVVIFSFLIVNSICLFSQNEINFEEHRKYWYYKKRLHDKFVNVGLQSTVDCNSSGGQSIPAARYNDGTLEYSEDNLMWFGQYMGVLATEYKLLEMNGETNDAIKVKEELYYAMMAYERLDRKSETLPYIFDSPTPTPNCNAGVNGFFIRGDVAMPSWYNTGYNYTATSGGCNSDGWIYDDCGFGITPTLLQTELEDQHPDFYSQYNNGVEDDPTMTYFYHLKCCEKKAKQSQNTDWLANQLGITKNSARKWGAMNFYPSQDQIASLFMGFALVKKCMDGVTYNGYNFKDKAINYTHLITSYLRNNDWFGKLEDGTPHQWGRTFRYEAGWGLAKAAQKITGQEYLGSDDYFHLAKSKIYWEYLDHPNTPLPFNLITWPIHEDIFAVGLQPLIFMQSKKDYHTNFMQIYGAISDSWTLAGWDLAEYGRVTDQGLNSLLHAFLHDRTVKPPLTKSYFKNRIEDAPCKGIMYEPVDEPNNIGVEDWRGVNRWWHPEKNSNDYDDSSIGDSKRGHFNGLDYMILFNLYNLVYEDEAYDNYRNVHEDNVTFTGPIPAIDNTTCGRPYFTLSFNDITFDNAWLRDGINYTFKAQNSIHFKPGFSTGNFCSGSSYKFVIDKVDCSDNPTDYFRPANTGGDDGEIDSESDVLTDDIIIKEELISEKESNFIEIYPNPSKGIFTVQSSNPLSKIEVYDMYGRFISRQSYNDNISTEIDLTNSVEGVYFIHISSETETVIKKVIKQ